MRTYLIFRQELFESPETARVEFELIGKIAAMSVTEALRLAIKSFGHMIAVAP